MSVWFKYAGDKDITPGHPGGSSVFAPPSGGGGGFPAYGTVLYTEYGYSYALGAGQYSSILAYIVETQICDVDVVADGVGGSFIDWASAGNIQYKPYGTVVANDPTPWASGSVEVPTGSYNFITSGVYNGGKNEIHDGLGNLIFEGVGTFTYYASGSATGASSNVGNTTEVPTGGTAFDNGTGMSYPYLWDGSGGYYESATGNSYGSYYSSGTEVDSSLRYHGPDYQTEVPAASGHFENNGTWGRYTYYWDGSGGYYDDYHSTGGSYVSFGTYIYNDGTYDYYWDGNGGYYT